VTHPNSTLSVYPLERLTKLYDGIEQLEDDGWAEDMSDGDESVGEENGEGVWLNDDGGVWRYRLENEAEGQDWEETDDRGGHGDGDAMDVDDSMDVDEANHTTVVSPLNTSSPSVQPISVPAPSSAVQKLTDQRQDALPNGDVHQGGGELNAGVEDSQWKRFDILASAPHDHAFYTSAPAQPSKNFLGRLSKEYRVLSNSLPGLCILYLFKIFLVKTNRPPRINHCSRIRRSHRSSPISYNWTGQHTIPRCPICY
jgi:ubiquitin-conjugating enzyme E2 O